MRRLLSIALLLVFGLPLVSPLMAMTPDMESRLPMCCRKAGGHHCAMSMEQAAAMVSGTEWRPKLETCPAYPQAVRPAGHHDAAMAAAEMKFSAAVSHPSMQWQAEARARVALDRARGVRGPPVVVLS